MYKVIPGPAKAMANSNGREVLRGIEASVLDLMAEALTPDKWAELLMAPLERAAKRGNRGLAQKLMEAGAEIGGALHEAVLGGHGDIMNDLLEKGASVGSLNTDGETPLHHAAQRGATGMVKVLLLKGADKNAKDSRERTPLHRANHFGHEEAALALLAGGADINLRYDGAKSTVVHLAVQKERASVLKAAIEHGADVDAADVHQNTPLHVAGHFNNVGAIDVLMEAGANIEARDGNGCTPLHYAAINVSLAALRSFLSHGADVNTRNKQWGTPLYYAACNAWDAGAAYMVDLLLRSGADEASVDRHGIKAAEVVGEWGDEETAGDPEGVERVCKLLENAPADRRWRRRGYLVLCRAHAARVQQQTQEQSSGIKDAVDESGDGNKLAVDEGGDGGGVRALRNVLALREDDLFRAVVGYL